MIAKLRSNLRHWVDHRLIESFCHWWIGHTESIPCLHGCFPPPEVSLGTSVQRCSELTGQDEFQRVWYLLIFISPPFHTVQSYKLPLHELLPLPNNLLCFFDTEAWFRFLEYRLEQIEADQVRLVWNVLHPLWVMLDWLPQLIFVHTFSMWIEDVLLHGFPAHDKQSFELPLVQTDDQALTLLSVQNPNLDLACLRHSHDQVLELWLRGELPICLPLHLVGVGIEPVKWFEEGDLVLVFKEREHFRHRQVLLNLQLNLVVSVHNPLAHDYAKDPVAALCHYHLLLRRDCLTYTSLAVWTADHLVLFQDALRHVLKGVEALLQFKSLLAFHDHYFHQEKQCCRLLLINHSRDKWLSLRMIGHMHVFTDIALVELMHLLLFLILQLFFKHFKLGARVLILLWVERLWDLLLILILSVDQFEHAVKLTLVCGCLTTSDCISPALVQWIAELRNLWIWGIVNTALHHARIVTVWCSWFLLVHFWLPTLAQTAISIRIRPFAFFFRPVLLSDLSRLLLQTHGSTRACWVRKLHRWHVGHGCLHWLQLFLRRAEEVWHTSTTMTLYVTSLL